MYIVFQISQILEPFLDLSLPVTEEKVYIQHRSVTAKLLLFSYPSVFTDVLGAQKNCPLRRVGRVD